MTLILALAAVLWSSAREAPFALRRAAAEPQDVLPLDLPAGAEPRSLEVGAVDPAGCAVKDRGLFEYVELERINAARVFVRPGAVEDDGKFDWILYFHGGGAAVNLLAPESPSYAIVTYDLGNGSSKYANALGSIEAFQVLKNALAARVTESTNAKAFPRKVLLASWSAGYKAIEGLLPILSDEPDFSGTVLLDSLHASFDKGRHLPEGALAPFVKAARKAADGGPPFFLIHTEITTPDYASTTETASFLLEAIGVKAERTPTEPKDFSLNRLAREGNFELRGYTGVDEAAHCNVLYLLPELTRVARNRAPH